MYSCGLDEKQKWGVTADQGKVLELPTSKREERQQFFTAGSGSGKTKYGYLDALYAVHSAGHSGDMHCMNAGYSACMLHFRRNSTLLHDHMPAAACREAKQTVADADHRVQGKT